jgi:hypothetical protein
MWVPTDILTRQFVRLKQQKKTKWWWSSAGSNNPR